MKKVLTVFLVGILTLSMLLCSCNDSSDDDIFANNTSAKTTKATTATTAPQQDVEIPTQLEAEIEVSNRILSRLTEKPVVREIGDTGVTIELNYQAWPTICKGDGDTLYVAASVRQSHIDPFAATAFYVSHDNGETWSDAKIINDTPVDDRDTGIVYLGNGRMLVSFFTIGASDFLSGGSYENSWGHCTAEQKAAKLQEWKSIGDADLAHYKGSFVILSDDYGETWSEPISVPVSCPHGPSLMQNGRTLLYAGLSGNTFVTYRSNDYGKTWTLYSELALPELPNANWGYWECYAIQLSDGSFVGGIRTGTTGGTDENGQKYNGNLTLGVLVTTSKDGKNWTEATKIPTVTGAPPHFLELDNGAVFLAYSYRYTTTATGIGETGARGCISYDRGLTWSETEIVLSRNTSANCADLGYPSTVQLSDGSLLSVYYQAYGQDSNCSVLYTKWRLNEVK